MAHIFRVRANQFHIAGLYDASAPTQAQVVALLQRQASLSPDEADRLEAGLIWIVVHVETVLQQFLEAGGLAPMLERSIRPGATELLEQAVGSCPPVQLPPKTGILVSRPVLLKAILVEVGNSLYQLFPCVVLPLSSHSSIKQFTYSTTGDCCERRYTVADGVRCALPHYFLQFCEFVR